MQQLTVRLRVLPVGALMALTLFGTAGCDLIMGCDSGTRPRDQSARVSIQQGVWGQVWAFEGNFMPNGADECEGGEVSAVERTILVVEPVYMNAHAPLQRHDDWVGPGWFYRAPPTAVVDSARSDRQGFFELELPPGSYSLLIREDTLLYANFFDAGVVGGVVIPPDGRVRVQLDIKYKAAL